MRKRIFYFLLFAIVAVNVYGKPDNITQKLNFDITIENIIPYIENNGIDSLKSKDLVLDGILYSYEVTDSSKENYTIELILVNGKWTGTADVHLYRCVVVFTGSQYSVLFPAKKSRTASGQAELNSRVLVLCKLEGLRESTVTGKIPVLKGESFRFQ